MESRFEMTFRHLIFALPAWGKKCAGDGSESIVLFPEIESNILIEKHEDLMEM